jgi:hypothetical protein
MVRVLGFECGRGRLPRENLTDEEYRCLAAEIQALGLSEWL